MAEKQVGVVIYTYDRVDDVKISMEIIRNTWSKYKGLDNIPIVHVFNGDKNWWPEKYLEDELIFLKNSGHFSGCAQQMDVGVSILQEKYKSVSHVVVLAADTWIMEPEYLNNLIDSMIEDERFLATCGWSEPLENTRVWRDAAVDFFVVDLKFNRSHKMFPLSYSGYIEKYGEVFGLLGMIVYVEQLLVLRFRQALLRYIGHPPPSENLIDKIVLEYIYLMKDREPVNLYSPKYERRMYFPVLGLIGHHEPLPKQIALKNYDCSNLGVHTKRFLESTDLSYFNNSVTNVAFVNKGKKFKTN